METFGQATRRMRGSVSLRELARRAYLDPGHLSKIENDVRPPTRAVAEALDTALNAGGALIDLAATIREQRGSERSGRRSDQAEIDGRRPVEDPIRNPESGTGGLTGRSFSQTKWDDGDVLPHATEIIFGNPMELPSASADDLFPSMSPESPRHIGAGDVARIEVTTSMFRDWDNRWGGGLSRAAVVAQVQWVAASAARSVCGSIEVKSRLLTALADLAGVAAFLCYDVEQHRQARALWLLGLRAAKEAGNIDVAGTTLRQLAHQSLHLNRADEALRLVQLAYAVTVYPAHNASELALAEIASYEGWCHAAAGRVQPCHRALGRAQEHFDNADGQTPPPWLAHLDAPELVGTRGHSYHVLAYHVPNMATLAIEPLQVAIGACDAGYARSKALNLIALSAAHFQCTNIDEGVAIGDQALAGAASLSSPRALSRLRALTALTEPYAGHSDVVGFRRRLQEALARA